MIVVITSGQRASAALSEQPVGRPRRRPRRVLLVRSDRAPLEPGGPQSEPHHDGRDTARHRRVVSPPRGGQRQLPYHAGAQIHAGDHPQVLRVRRRPSVPHQVPPAAEDHHEQEHSAHQRQRRNIAGRRPHPRLRSSLARVHQFRLHRQSPRYLRRRRGFNTPQTDVLQ